MSVNTLISLSPYLALAATAVAAMLTIAVKRSHALTAGVTLAGMLLAGGLLPWAASARSPDVTDLLIVDGYALVYLGLLLAATFITGLLSYDYLDRHAGRVEEFYVLLVLALIGSSVLAASRHFASFFLGLEVLSVSLYVMIGYFRERATSIEAAVKYLILAAASSAVLLFGMALIYARTGTLQFVPVVETLSAVAAPDRDLLAVTGLAMLVGGIGFKLAVVPFHLWTPDVYEGAPAPVAGFVATVSKGGVLAVLLRYFHVIGLEPDQALFAVFALIAVLSMFAGNLLALLQNNVKRILAYSSIAHFGYLLVAFLAGGRFGTTAVTFYLAAYFVTILAAFGVVAVVSTDQRDADALDDYRGLFWRRPWLGGLFAGSLLSLIGMPLTAGFVGKFYVFLAGVEADLWVLAWALVLSTAIGLYYYLRIVMTLFLPAEGVENVAGPAVPPPLAPASQFGLAVLGIALFTLGLYPSPLIDVIDSSPPSSVIAHAGAQTVRGDRHQRDIGDREGLARQRRPADIVGTGVDAAQSLQRSLPIAGRGVDGDRDGRVPPGR